MNHDDHVALIREGVGGAGPRWLELGAGDGAFTLAIADVLGPGGDIRTLDRDHRALQVGADAVARRFPGTRLVATMGDFNRGLPTGPFDGVLAANSLHFVAGRGPLLGRIRDELRPGGHLVVVEYDSDAGNPWVPYPFTPARFQEEATEAGFGNVRVLHRVPSRFLGGIYGALAVRTSAAGPAGNGAGAGPSGDG